MIINLMILKIITIGICIFLFIPLLVRKNIIHISSSLVMLVTVFSTSSAIFTKGNSVEIGFFGMVMAVLVSIWSAAGAALYYRRNKSTTQNSKEELRG